MENGEKDLGSLLKGQMIKLEEDNFTGDLDRDVKDVCYDICRKIYISRNISLREDSIMQQLRRLDHLLRDGENYN